MSESLEFAIKTLTDQLSRERTEAHEVNLKRESTLKHLVSSILAFDANRKITNSRIQSIETAIAKLGYQVPEFTYHSATPPSVAWPSQMAPQMNATGYLGSLVGPGQQALAAQQAMSNLYQGAQPVKTIGP